VPRHGEAHCLNGSAQRCNSLLKNGFFCIFVVKGIFLFHFRVEYFLHIYGASNTGLHFFSAKQEALTTHVQRFQVRFRHIWRKALPLPGLPHAHFSRGMHEKS
jgi:hypothetical protein